MAHNHLFQALAQYGPAPGARVMMDREMEAAQEALISGIYVTWRSNKTKEDCTRIGSKSLCFCGHSFSGHKINLKKNQYPCSQAGCRCSRFEYIITRPEEVGEWWLPRRKDFQVHLYQATCKCKHSHIQHKPSFSRQCMACPCSGFRSNFLCVVCDAHWEEHETTWQTKGNDVMIHCKVG